MSAATATATGATATATTAATPTPTPHLPVLYRCGCTNNKPGRLEDLFFCYECNEARCSGRCTIEEIVSYFCPRCLTNYLSREALDNGSR